MAQVLIRDIAPDLVEKLKARAQRNHRSLEAELRVICTEAVRTPAGAIEEDLERVRALFSGRTFSDSAVLLRDDRGR